MTNLRGYWTQQMAELQEFALIADIEDDMIDLMLEELQNIMLDQFIQTATAEGIARRESMLKIQPFFDDTLETRRFRVMTRWGNVLPYTLNRLHNVLTTLVGSDGYEVTVDYGLYTLDVLINLGQSNMLADTNTMVSAMVPANLVVTVDLRYNRHEDLIFYTHDQLSAKTHDQIRGEEL